MLSIKLGNYRPRDEQVGWIVEILKDPLIAGPVRPYYSGDEIYPIDDLLSALANVESVPSSVKDGLWNAVGWVANEQNAG